MKGMTLQELADEILKSAIAATDAPENKHLVEQFGRKKVLATFLGASIGAFNPQTPGVDFVDDGKVIHSIEGRKP